MPVSREVLAAHAEELVVRAVRQLSPDVVQALEQAGREESEEGARGVLETILERARTAKEKGRGLSSDTGLISFYVEAGTAFPALAELKDALRDGVQAATKHEPLASHAADITSGVACPDNTGRSLPIIHVDLVPGADDCRLTVFLKCAASERLSALWILPPKTTMDEIGDRLASHVAAAGGTPSPPLVVGVGMGGTPDQALLMARQALLRPVGEPSTEEALREREVAWKKAVDATGVGPMGLGGGCTALAVHAACADRHVSLLPVGVSVACWSDTRASVQVDAAGAARW